MRYLIEIREHLRSFFNRFEIYILPVIRFAVALVTFLLINSSLGYMRRLNNPAVALVMALICTFLPVSVMVFFASVLVLLHLFSLSLEVCIVALLLFLVMFCLYFIFVPKSGYAAILTPVLSVLHIPHVVPLAIGLGAKIHTSIAMVCGIISYYFLRTVRINQTVLGQKAESGSDEVSKFTVLLEYFFHTNEMYLVILAFLLTAILVNVIRRLDFKYSWIVAICVGNVVNLVVLLGGNVVLGTSLSIVGTLIGVAAAFVVGGVMHFFMFHLDYSRTERVQFEDDDYYYYVKAVPKIQMSTSEKDVKQINRRKGDGISKKELAEEFEISRDLLDD